MANFAWASLSLLLAISFFAEGIKATGVLHVARQGEQKLYSLRQGPHALRA